MLFRMLYDDKLAQASYLIGCQRTGEALIIDPERDVERYIKAAAQEGMRLAAITETHIHADFLSGCRELAEATGAKLYLSDEGDADWKYQWLHQKSGGGSYPHELLKHGSIFKVGNIQIQALHTPGHTPEHMSFMVTDLGGGATEPMGIATGDFVFVGDVGRPDLLETAAGQVGKKNQRVRCFIPCKYSKSCRTICNCGRGMAPARRAAKRWERCRNPRWAMKNASMPRWLMPPKRRVLSKPYLTAKASRHFISAA